MSAEVDIKYHEGNYGPQHLWLEVPKNAVGFVVGKGRKNLYYIMEKTRTIIEASEGDKMSYFIIEGSPENQLNAKLKLKRLAMSCKKKNEGLDQNRFAFIDASKGTFKLQPTTHHIYPATLSLKLPDDLEENSGIRNYNLLLQELPKILMKNQEIDRSSNIWCHFGKIHIKSNGDGILDYDKEHTLYEVERQVIPKRYFHAPEEVMWHIKFFTGLNLEKRDLDVLHKEWFTPESQKCVPYKRCEITFYTPSCNELRLKIFITVDIERSNSSRLVYKSFQCPHEIQSVIRHRSDSPPFFYICESTPKTALVDIFEPSAQVDIRLITEAIRTDSPDQEDDLYREATILYEYVKKHMTINDEGEVDLPEIHCPSDFEYVYSRASVRETFSFTIEGEQLTTQLSYEVSNNAGENDYDFHNGDWDIHISCNNVTPEQVTYRIPKLLSHAKKLARAVSKSDQNQQTVPPEILARGNKAKIAYQIALKSGQIKNRRLPIAVIGQSRSGKTSLLRSLNGEKFNPVEDSTSGVKLQRSLSKVEDGDWQKDETSDTHMLYNQFAAKEVVKYLMMPRSIDSVDSNNDIDNNFDYDEHSNYNSSIYNKNKLHNADFMSEVNRESELKIFFKKGKSLHIGEDLKVANEHFKPIQRDFKNDNETIVETKQLPEDVATCTKNFLENPDSVVKMENYLYFHTMDFAGQPVYSVTHPVFLPPKGIFLLVHNLENDLHAQATPMVRDGAVEETLDDHCPMTNMDHLEFWLSLVAANSTLERGSPVFMVCTHADQIPLPNAEKIAGQILDNLTRDNFSPGTHVVYGMYIVDNTVSGSGGSKSDPGVQSLKAALSNKARSLPQLDEDIPIRWLLFEKRLMSVVKKEQKKYISHEEAKAIALQNEVDVESDELDTLLEYLHDLKVIIYFQKIDMIIIDTQWLLDVFAKVITVPRIQYHEGYRHEWRKLEHEGIVDETFLKHLWKDLLDDDRCMSVMVHIMEEFFLICKQQDGSYLVPAMLLNTAESSELIAEVDEMVSPLVIQFKSSILPFGVFQRLLIAVEQMCTLRWPDPSPPYLSKNFARFYIVHGTFNLVLVSNVQTITVALINQDLRDDRDDQLCASILTFLDERLHIMMKSFPWMKNLEFDFGIRCPVCINAAPCTKHNKMACSRDSCVHFVSEKELRKNIKPRCNKSPSKLKNVIPGSSYLHWFREQDNPAEAKEAQKQSQGFCLASTSTEDDALHKEVIAAVNQISLKTISQDEVTRTAKRIADTFNLDKNSTDTPPKDIIQKCRTSCKCLVAKGGRVFVEALRKELPSGMTGPLRIGYDVKVCDMDSVTKTQFSQALTAKEMEWKAFAKEKVGLSPDEIEFLDKRKSNPVLEILNEHCRDWSVEQLYGAVSSVGAEAVADRYF